MAVKLGPTQALRYALSNLVLRVCQIMNVEVEHVKNDRMTICIM